MKKKYIVKENKDFEKIINEGKLRKNRSFLVYSLDNNLTYNKYGISVIDNLKKDYNIGKNYIIITRKGALDKNYQELNNDLSNLI